MLVRMKREERLRGAAENGLESSDATFADAVSENPRTLKSMSALPPVVRSQPSALSFLPSLGLSAVSGGVREWRPKG